MILIVDDDKAIRESLCFLLHYMGHEVEAVGSPGALLLKLAKDEPIELVLMDMNFGPGTSGTDGLRLLEEVKRKYPAIPVILMTAWGEVELAVKGMKLGAFDFITKPWENNLLIQRIELALDAASNFPKRSTSSKVNVHKIIGKDPVLLDIIDTIERIAPTDAPILITGESGTGKELVAEMIHQQSQRNKGPFVKVNLGGISTSLFESEMFGYKKGAYTGAVADHKGRFDLANGGTIFLDEIGELDLTRQVKLLRVLQEQTFEALGDPHPHKVNVRVVSATNAPLHSMVINKTFREDLLYRINLITLHLPPLRQRKEDIPLLVNHFVKGIHNTDDITISENAINYLCSLNYPGNIRELKNMVERTLLLADKQHITAEDFIKYGNDNLRISPSLTTENNNSEIIKLDDLERFTIEKTLRRFSGNVSNTALALGISRQALYRKIEKYNIKL